MIGRQGDSRVKMLILGQSSVGKSSLLEQYVDSHFSNEHSVTIGIQYKQKVVQIEEAGQVRIQIWDTAGTARYQTITPNYYRNVDGILLVFDLTQRNTFEMVSYWVKEVNQKTDIAKIDLLLVGNKLDLESSREVTEEEGCRLAEDIGIKYIQTSATNHEETQVAFDRLVAKILRRKRQLLEGTESGFQLKLKKLPAKGQDKCC